MNNRKYFFLIPVFLLLFAGLFGCGKKEQNQTEYQIFYINKQGTRVVGREYEPETKGGDTEALVKEFLVQLTTDSGDVELKKTIPNGVEVTNCTLKNSVLSIYFDNDYSTMDTVTEVLLRAAVVRTLTQIKGVECITFYVGDSPLSDSMGNLVGVMTSESFIENPGEQINSIQTSTIVLYFADKDGDGLIQETQEVHYSSNISMEKLVMEHLLKGPESKHAQSAIPAGTKLVNVSVLDGVCYVSLDETFLNQNYEIKEPIVIYSIVNSLSEISTINKVQISVNGDTKGVYRDSYTFDVMYERNLDYVTSVEEEEVVVDDMNGEMEVEVSSE